MAERWRSHEDDILRRLYSERVPLSVIARELGRSEDAVTARRRAIGIPVRQSPRPWTMLEDELLRRATQAKLPTTAVAPRLRRSVDQVRVRRRQLGLGRAVRSYTATEDALLRAEWGSGADVDALGRRFGRSPDALRLHARQLGLHAPRRRRRWNDSEDAIVRRGYADGLTCAEIAARLGQRSVTAVAARARKLGLTTYARKWTAADDAKLAHMLGRGPVDEVARALGRTPEAIRRRARKLGVPVSERRQSRRAGTRWSAEEDALLARHAASNPALLSARLGRSDQAIVNRLRRLGLREGRWRSPHHPSPSDGRLTPAERTMVDRELDHRGPRALPALEHRLGRPLDAAAELARARRRSVTS